MNNTIRMNNGAMVLNYMDATSILQSTSKRHTKFPHHPIGSIWFHYGGQWPILISCILSSFIPLVKAYMLGLSIFFHSLMKFFIDGKKMNYLLQIFFFSFNLYISIKKILMVVSGKIPWMWSFDCYGLGVLK